MYKMCNDQWDGESDDEKNPLCSSFWSDGEVEDKDEEGEITRATDPRPVNDPEGSRPETSREKRPELESQEVFNGGALEEESDYDRETTSGSNGSAPESPMTSGYGTYRAEEKNSADHGDDHSMIGFNQDSREDLLEFRDDKGDSRSLGCFTDVASEPTHGPDVSEPVVCVSERRRVPAVAAWCEDGRTPKEVSIVDTTPVVTEPPSEEQLLHSDADDTLLFHNWSFEDGIDGDEARNHLEPLRSPDPVSAIDFPDESSSNKDAASCLEERMAELDLASSDQDYEADENDSQSTETDGVDFSAFESYIKGMTQSDREVRPKPKSFIRPVMCQKTMKKTDPVAKYFQYKEMWEMFQVPGEKDRKALRWEIKEKLSFQPLPPKPRRVYMPNTYIVPTEKKRSELRWMIRNDLANGRLPQKLNSQF